MAESLTQEQEKSSKTQAEGYSAAEVAKYFIHLADQEVVDEKKSDGSKICEGITNLRLQKLLYFAQAYYLGALGRKLFSDEIEAWAYGPVVPEIYHRYKEYANTPIAEVVNEQDLDLSGKDKGLLKEVWEGYGCYSTSYLVQASHAHDPWKDAYEKSESAVISKEHMQAYYSPILSK